MWDTALGKTGGSTRPDRWRSWLNKLKGFDGAPVSLYTWYILCKQYHSKYSKSVSPGRPPYKPEEQFQLYTISPPGFLPKSWIQVSPVTVKISMKLFDLIWWFFGPILPPWTCDEGPPKREGRWKRHWLRTEPLTR